MIDLKVTKNVNQPNNSNKLKFFNICFFSFKEPKAWNTLLGKQWSIFTFYLSTEPFSCYGTLGRKKRKEGNTENKTEGLSAKYPT